MTKDRKLLVAEDFYSIQGEGPTMGYPAVFLRLAKCNLMCGGKGTEKDGKLHKGATWRCDTIETWMRGESVTIDQLIERFETRGYMDVLSGGARLIVTGGEPTMQQEAVLEFVDVLCDRVVMRSEAGEPYLEIETNGTYALSDDLLWRLDQVNVSPKLSNSGMSARVRIKPNVLSQYADHYKVYWKFVISSEEDWDEVQRDFIDQFGIETERVYLMPAASSRKELQRASLLVSELCKRHVLKYSTRMQVEIWDQVTGV